MKIWGKSALINLAGCDLEKIKSKKWISKWGDDLINLIKMKEYGDPFIERFALHDPGTTGYTYMQAIETSSITAHFSEFHRSVFINIFSCKNFDELEAAMFSLKHFDAAQHFIKVVNMIPDGRIF